MMRATNSGDSCYLAFIINDPKMINYVGIDEHLSDVLNDVILCDLYMFNLLCFFWFLILKKPFFYLICVGLELSSMISMIRKNKSPPKNSQTHLS